MNSERLLLGGGGRCLARGRRRLPGWRRWGRRARDGLLGPFLCDYRRTPPTPRIDGQHEGRDHKEHSDRRCQLAQEGGSTSATEDGLARAAPKGGADVGALAALQEHNRDKDNCNEQMESRKRNEHRYLLKAKGIHG